MSRRTKKPPEPAFDPDAPLRVVVAKPGELPYATEIAPSLEGFQSVFGDAVLDLVNCGTFTIYVDDEGILKGLPFNFRVGPHDLFGTAVFVGPATPMGDDTSLPRDVEAEILAALTLALVELEDPPGIVWVTVTPTLDELSTLRPR